jgi:AcrR family transcriptional regulator
MSLFRQRRQEKLRTLIAETAREMIVRQGYEGFSMRKLASKLGCSHGTLYLYFKDKRELFDFLVEDSFEQLAHTLQHRRHRGGTDPVQMLKDAGRTYVDFGRRNPNAYEFAFVIRRAGEKRPWKPHTSFRVLRDTIGRCIEEKIFRPVNVDVATQALWAAVHGVTSLLISRPNFPWVNPEELIGLVIDSAVDSLLSQQRPGPSRSKLAKSTVRAR